MKNTENKINKTLYEIETKDLSFKQFEQYYNEMTSLLAKGYSKEACNMGYSLYNANVLLDTYEKLEKFEEYKEKLEVIVGELARKYVEKTGANIPKIFEEMTQKVQNDSLTFKKYNYYVNLLIVAHMIKLENIDYLEIAKTLQSVNVKGNNSFDNVYLYVKSLLMLENFTNRLSVNDKRR